MFARALDVVAFVGQNFLLVLGYLLMLYKLVIWLRLRNCAQVLSCNYFGFRVVIRLST